MIVVLHLLGEDVTGVYDSSYVLHIDIFGLMAFTNHGFPKVEVFNTFLCNLCVLLYACFITVVYCCTILSFRHSQVVVTMFQGL